MPAIVFYADPNQKDGPSRIAGMTVAGQRVRGGAQNVTNPNQASQLVAGIVHDSLPGGATPGQVWLQTSAGDFKILSEQSSGHYRLDNNEKLLLRGDVDDKSGSTYRMSASFPPEQRAEHGRTSPTRSSRTS
jgi:hypothetical protein